MRHISVLAAGALLLQFVSGGARAANTLSVLQFGSSNLSTTVQAAGQGINTGTVLQFGAVNQATSIQSGTLVGTNSLAIGQGGTVTSSNNAIAAQVGGSNASLIGQIGTNNAARTLQVGVVNGSTVLQSVP